MQRPTVVEILSTRLSLLPSWVRIVGTTRSEPGVLSQLGGLRAHLLSAQDPRNQDDLRHFLHNRLAEPGLRNKAEASGKILLVLEKDLMKSSAGNFLFVTTDLQLVQSAIRLSAHVLARDRRQLAGQLTGRLLGNRTPCVQALLEQITKSSDFVWLRPLTPSLTQPGGPLVCTLEGHTGWVTAVAIIPDGRHAVSTSHDRTVQMWDLENGCRLRTLEGHTDRVHAVAVTPDGRRAISGSGDHTLRVWDLESGKTVRVLKGHTDWVTAVAVTPEGRWAISGSEDHTRSTSEAYDRPSLKRRGARQG